MYTKKRIKDFHVMLDMDDYRILVNKSKNINLCPSEFVRKCIREPTAFLDAKLKSLLALVSFNQNGDYVNIVDGKKGNEINPKDYSLSIGDETDTEIEDIKKDKTKIEEPVDHIIFSNGHLQIELYSSKCPIERLKDILFEIIDKTKGNASSEVKPYFG